MADEEKKAEETTQPAGGSKKLLIVVIILIVVIVAAGGAGAFFMLKGGKGEKAKKSEDDVADTSTNGKMGPTLQMKSFIINLDEPGGARYLKLSVELELRKALNEEQSKETIRVRDKIIVYLSGLRIVDVQKRKAKIKLKQSLLKIANEAYGAKRVRAVYFKEFVIQ